MKETDKEGEEAAKRSKRSSPWCREGKENLEGPGGRSRRGQEWDRRGHVPAETQAAAALEEIGAKFGVRGPWLSVLQQVGRWPLSLSSWVRNSTATPRPLPLSPSDRLLLGWREQILGRRELRTSDKTISSLEKFCLCVCAALKSLRGLNNKCHICTRRLISSANPPPTTKKNQDILRRGKLLTQQTRP